MCETCSGAEYNECTKCKSKNFLFRNSKDNKNGICVKECPSGTYTDQKTQECVVCDEACDECSGPGKNACLTCNKEKGFLM